MDFPINHYQETLDDLKLRRAKHLEEIRKLETAINSLQATMGVADATNHAPEIASTPPSEVEENPSERYKNMSVRWGILKLLYNDTLDPMSSADISTVLSEGGNPKASKATVSAVISDMVNQREEAVYNQQLGGYLLTAKGEAAWRAIAHSTRYINRTSYASELQQPE
jgi:hypothetical protein